MNKLLIIATELIEQADEFHGKFPDAATKVEEVFSPGLTQYNKAFEKLRKEVTRMKNKEKY